MLSNLVAIINSLKIEVLDKALNRALLINGYLFREDLNGWIYIGKIIIVKDFSFSSKF